MSKKRGTIRKAMSPEAASTIIGEREKARMASMGLEEQVRSCTDMLRLRECGGDQLGLR